MLITETIWLAIITGLLIIIAGLVSLGYRDFVRRFALQDSRISVLDKRQKRVISSLLKFAIETDPPKAHKLLAEAIEQLLDNGGK